MKQRSRRNPNSPRPRAVAGPAAIDPRRATAQRFTLALGYVIVGLSVVIGFVMSFWPQPFGLRGTHPAVGFGLAALAAFRLYALRREMRCQAREEGTC